MTTPGESKARRQLAAILSADAVGYSRRMAEDETATVAAMRSHRETLGGFVREHHGRVVNAVGDNLLAEFASADSWPGQSGNFFGVWEVCPFFVPSASIATKRPLRFVRHLRSFGWEPIVLTVEGSAGSGVDASQPLFTWPNRSSCGRTD